MTTSIMSRGSRLRKQRCAREALSPFGRRAQIRISPRAYAESASLSKKSGYGLTGRAVVRGMCCGLRQSLNTLPAPVPALGPEQFDAKSNTAGLSLTFVIHGLLPVSRISTFDRVGWIVVSRRRGVSGRHQAVQE